MVSEVPLMYGTVAIITVVGLVFVELGPLLCQRTTDPTPD